MPSLNDYMYLFFQAGAPTSGTAGSGAVVQFKRVPANTSTVATVNLAATTTATALAANANRLGASVMNSTGQIVNLKLGAGASGTSYTAVLAVGSYYEVPFGWNGIITAWSSVASTAPGLQVTEVSA